ncbi:MAG: hypothetical protein ABJJ39_00095, partial [Kangiellaceae bacterium]
TNVTVGLLIGGSGRISARTIKTNKLVFSHRYEDSVDLPSLHHKKRPGQTLKLNKENRTAKETASRDKHGYHVRDKHGYHANRFSILGEGIFRVVFYLKIA